MRKLESGAVDATWLNSPQDFQALDAGFTSVAISSDYLHDIAYNAYNFTHSWADAHIDLITRYLAAQRRAADWWYDIKNRDEAADILVGYTKSPKDLALRTYDFYREVGTIAPKGEVTDAATQGAIDVMIQGGLLEADKAPPITRIVDQSYMEKAAKIYP